MATIKVNEAKLDHTTGDDALKALAEDAGRKCATRWYEDPNCCYLVIDRKLEMDNAKYIVSQGGDVEDFALYIEIADENDLVPLGVTGALKTDEEGIEQQVTWLQWLAPNCFIIERDSRKFIGTQCCHAYPQGYLPLSGLVPVFDNLVKASDLPAVPEEE